MMIQQSRVRTQTYGDRRFDKTASTLWKTVLWNNVTCLVKPEMNKPWNVLRKMWKLIFLELLVVILCKLLTLTVLRVFFNNFYIYIYHSPFFNVCQFLISLLVNYFVVMHVFYVQFYCTIFLTMLSAKGNFN
jgi:hypothetical protein